jgi:putative ABC transport system permease protein
MIALFQDLRYGLRMLGKSPAFTFVAVITLALGIGANTAIFSVADAFLLRPVSFPDTDRLVMVMELSPGQTSDWNTVARGNLEDWKTQNRSFEPMAAGRWRNFNLTGSGDPERVLGAEVTPNFLDTLHERPLLGRVFVPDDETPGHEQQVVLGYGLWERAFGSDRSVIGRKVKLNGQAYTVIAVMPKGFTFPQSAELWVPMTSSTAKSDRTQHSLYVLTRMKPGVSLRQAQAEMDGIARRMAVAYPKTNQGWGVHVIPIAIFATGEETRSYTLMLLGAVAFVLLIACANVANLQLARATVREREMAVRLSLGAGRWRVVRQVLVESLVLASAGVVLGLVLAQWGVHLILAYMPPDVAKYLPGWDTISVNWRAFVYALTIALAAAIVSGLAPALQSSSVNVNEALKDGSRGGTTTRGRHRLRGAFVLLQVSLSLVLLVGSGLMTKGVWALIRVNEQASPRTLLTFNVNLRGDKYAAPRQKAAFCDRMLGELTSVPGVAGVAQASALPFGEGGDLNTDAFSIEGRPATSAADKHWAVAQYLSPSYLPLMGVALREGRLFTDDDTDLTAPVALINERMARRLWPNQTAIGRRIRWSSENDTGPWMTIVGIVADVRNSWMSEQPEPTIYSPFRQSPQGYAIVAIRTGESPAAMIASVRKRIAALDPELPLYEVKSYDQVIHESILGLEYVAVMLTVLGVIALLLAAVGLYGVISYLVTLRWHEIGIRLALGAQRHEVLGMALRWGLSLMMVGAAAGLLLATGLARLLAGLIYGVQAGDLQVFFVATLSLAVAAVLATLIPALRASRADPMVALRYE